jgi:hypothetical protein
MLAATLAMTDDTILPFSFPAVSRKKITAAFDGGGNVKLRRSLGTAVSLPAIESATVRVAADKIAAMRMRLYFSAATLEP